MIVRTASVATHGWKSHAVLDLLPWRRDHARRPDRPTWSLRHAGLDPPHPFYHATQVSQPGYLGFRVVCPLAVGRTEVSESEELDAWLGGEGLGRGELRLIDGPPVVEYAEDMVF